MNIKFKIFETCSKLVFSFLFLIFLLCISCGYTPQNDALPKSLPVSQTNNISQNSEPVLIVQKFMQYVSENKLVEANALVKTPPQVSETKERQQEAISKLNWAEVFKERNFSLEKIISNDISEKGAKVKALLNYDNDPRIKVEADFTLNNTDNQWFIYDIELITGKDINR